MKEGAFLLIRKSRNSGNEVAKYKQTKPAFTCSKLKIETLDNFEHISHYVLHVIAGWKLIVHMLMVSQNN